MNASPTATSGSLWPAMRGLFRSRQHLIPFLVAISLVDALTIVAIAAAIGQLDSFSELARAIFHDLETTSDAVGEAGDGNAWAVVALAGGAVVAAVVAAWLRAGYLIGFGGGEATLRPPLRYVLRLAVLTLATAVLAMAWATMLENDLPVPAIAMFLVLAVATLYADYAIVFEDAPVVTGLVRSFEVVRATATRTLLVWFVLFLLGNVLYGVFRGGFEDGSSVQPTYLVAWILLGSLLQYLTDVGLVAVYSLAPVPPRSTPQAPVDDL